MKPSLLSRLALLSAAIFFSAFCIAGELPKSIDFFTQKGIPGKFLKGYDPGYVVIKLDSGGMIDTKYSGIDFETIYMWEKDVEKTGTPRDVMITYSLNRGVVAKDIETGMTFELDGTLVNHPIDVAQSECQIQYSSTSGMKHCSQLVLKAWEVELQKAYEALGGKENPALTHSQEAWLEFRDKQLTYLKSQYSSRRGTIWGVVYMNHVVAMAKDRAKFLQSIKQSAES